MSASQHLVDEQNELLGIFTSRDVVDRVIASGRDAESTLLSHIMTTQPATLLTNNNAIEAMRLMWDVGFRHIPVLENGQVAGVVCRSDFKSDEEIQLGGCPRIAIVARA